MCLRQSHVISQRLYILIFFPLLPATLGFPARRTGPGKIFPFNQQVDGLVWPSLRSVWERNVIPRRDRCSHSQTRNTIWGSEAPSTIEHEHSVGRAHDLLKTSHISLGCPLPLYVAGWKATAALKSPNQTPRRLFRHAKLWAACWGAPSQLCAIMN